MAEGMGSGMNEPIDVAELLPATTWLNFRGDKRRAVLVGQYMGQNTLGEYLTVVSADWDGNAGFGHTRVGLAYGIYTIAGEPTDEAGFPADVAVAERRRLIARDWFALHTPGINPPGIKG